MDYYLQFEVQMGGVAGPFLEPPLPCLHVNGFGILSKRNPENRVILDLSGPKGHSINDGIASKDYSLQYMKVDDIIAGIMQMGRGSLMAKFEF